MTDYLSIGYMAGYVGLVFGIFVPLPQLYRMIKTKKSNDVSTLTYVFLCLAMIGYLIHAIWINAPVFIAAQAFNLSTNTIVLSILIGRKVKYG